MDLEEVWRIREEDIYPALFGPESRGIFTLSQQFFADRFRQSDIDPRWMFYGVIEFAPTASRPSWLYVTSGHSNPWYDEPKDYDPGRRSGAGVEFTLQTTSQGDWPIVALQYVQALDLLLQAGRYKGRHPLKPADCVPLGASIDGSNNGLLRNVMIAPAEGHTKAFELPSGKVDFLSLTAIADAERDHAESSSAEILLTKLRLMGHHPVNDPARASVV